MKGLESIFDESICAGGKWQAVVTLQQMLFLSDREGIVDMTAEAISRRSTIPLSVISEGIAELSKPDDQSRYLANDGRYIVPLTGARNWGWRIVNYSTYLGQKNLDKRREQNRNAQARWREKHRPSSDVK